MSTIEGKFDKRDFEDLMEAVGMWEVSGQPEMHIIQALKLLPQPSRDDHPEQYEMYAQARERLSEMEKEYVNRHKLRREKSIILKAKLLMASQDLAVNELFDASKMVPETPTASGDVNKAEEFIRHFGIWDTYQKYLTGQK